MINAGDQNIAQYSVAPAIEFERIFSCLLNFDMKAPQSTVAMESPHVSYGKADYRNVA